MSQSSLAKWSVRLHGGAGTFGGLFGACGGIMVGPGGDDEFAADAEAAGEETDIGIESPEDLDSTEIQPLLSPDDPRTRTVLVSLLELSPAEREAAADRIPAELASADEHPVFVTDSTDFSLYVKAGCFYEYLPPIADQVQHASGQAWDTYLARKVQLMLAKWQPERVIACGSTIEDFIRHAGEAHRAPRELPP
jgi:hypothetical protein